MGKHASDGRNNCDVVMLLLSHSYYLVLPVILTSSIRQPMNLQHFLYEHHYASLRSRIGRQMRVAAATSKQNSVTY